MKSEYLKQKTLFYYPMKVFKLLITLGSIYLTVYLIDKILTIYV